MVATVDGEGRVAVTNLLAAGMTATVSIRVRDATPVNSAVAVITIAFAAGVDFSPSGAGFVVSLDSATATVTLLTLTGSGGMGGLRFNQLGYSSYVRVGADGELVVPHFPRRASTVTVSVLVLDATWVNVATVAVTVAFVGGPYEQVRFSPHWADFLVSRYYTGVVVTLTATGGFGDYRYECRGVNCDSFGVDADSGVVSLTAAWPFFRANAHFGVWDRGGHRGSFNLDLRVDEGDFTDAAMFIMGGNSGTAASDYEGVLRSTDGVNWVSLRFSGEARHNHQMVFHDGSLWVIGGNDKDDGYLDDIWYSADGESWTSVVVSGEHFSGRSGHQAVSFGGDLWVFGGEDADGNLNDVWRSADGGGNWTREVENAPWEARRRHQVIVYRGSLWLTGGYDGSTNFDDVWRSADGENWFEVTVSGNSWAGRRSHQVVSYRNYMLLMGGRGDDTAYGDVWSSNGGVTWRPADVQWEARHAHQMASYRGSLWLVGGFNKENNGGEGETFGDVWRRWTYGGWEEVAVAEPSPFPARRFHQLAVMPGPPSLYELVRMAVTAPTVTVTVALDSATAPVTVATLTASGGVGDARRFEVAGDAAMVATVDGEGRVAVTKFLAAGMTATVSIRVRDATPANSAVAVITIAFAASSGGGAESVGVGFSPGSAGFLLSPGFTGAVLTISAMAPEPMVFAYQQVGDSRTGVVSVVRPLEGEGEGEFFFDEGGGGAVYAELGGRCAGGDAGDVGYRGGGDSGYQGVGGDVVDEGDGCGGLFFGAGWASGGGF